MRDFITSKERVGSKKMRMLKKAFSLIGALSLFMTLSLQISTVSEASNGTIKTINI